jgi:hypothetical protein
MKKKLLFLAIILLLCGCNINTDRTGGYSSDILHTPIGSIEVTESVFPDEGYPKPIGFESEEHLIAAIQGEEQLEYRVDADCVTNIKFYFKPEKLPEGVTLADITVHEAVISFLYPFSSEPDPDLENTYVFEWLRYKEKIDSKDTNIYYDIQKTKPYDKNDTTRCMRQDVYWRQYGYAFHAVVPAYFTKADIAKYCVAKKVEVK